MSLETRGIEELRAKPEVDLSDAEIPSTLATAAERVDNEEPEEHETENASETTSAELTPLDSFIDGNDAGSTAALGAVPERLEIKTTEESETEFEAGFTKDLLHLLGFNGAESPSDTVTEQEHLENGEFKDPRMDEPVAEVARYTPDSLTDGNDAVTLSYRDAVQERLEDGEGEEPKAEEPAAEVASNTPDSLTDGNDAVTLSYRDAVQERLEDGEGEEPKAEEPAAEVASTGVNEPDSLTESDDAATLSYRDAVQEHLDDGNGDEHKVEEPAAEATSTYINVHDPLADSSDAVTLSYRDAVLEHLDDGNVDEHKAEEPAAEVASTDLHVPDSFTDSNDGVNLSDLATATECSSIQPREEATKEDHVEELVVDTGFGDAVEVCSLPLEAVAQDGVDKVQVTSDYATEKNESELIFENANESDSTTILEGAIDNLSSSMQLPLEVGKNVIQLQCESSAPDAPDGICLVNIVGTAHVSKASCEEVQALIRHVKPEVVFLELCSSRTNVLLPSKREVPSLSSMIESYKKKQMNLFGIIYGWFLAKVGEKLEVVPGTEFRVAYEEAVRCGASVTLGDRPIQITLKRTWGKMSIWQKAKFLCSMLTASFVLPSADEFQALVEKMGQSDELTIMIQELSKTYPTLLETLVVERDLYMVASLRTVARRYSSVVAVVGRGHLSGIADHWTKDINVDELLVVPPKNPWSRVWLWGTVAIGVGGIVVGIDILRRR